MPTRAFTSIVATRRTTLCMAAAFALALGLLLPFASHTLPVSKEAITATTQPDMARLPISFEPNAGQTNPAARFVAHAAGGTLYFTPSEVVLTLSAPNQTNSTLSNSNLNPKSKIQNPKSSDVHLQFIGANLAPRMQSGSVMPGKVSYLIGKDPAKWHTDLPTYGEITYSELYPGTNLVYSGTGGQLKGTYTLAPGADPNAISWRYAGVDDTALDTNGNLQLTTQSKITLTEHAPQAWQEIGRERVPVTSSYAIRPDGTLGFALGEYDHSQALTIDPTLTYSTYLGGFYGDGVGGIALDSAGNIYVTGATTSSDFPTAGNPFQPVWGGQYDAFVTKLSPDGSTLIYSTFLGGDGEIDGGDFGDFVAVDANGNAIVAGSTDADNFPTTPGAYQTQYADTTDLFVAKLNSTGSALIFGTYYGYSGVEEPGGFAVDPAGNTYMTGYWYAGRDRYAFVTELNAAGSALVFQRALGGHSPGPGDQDASSEGRGIALDSSGNIYVTGDTRAADFPITQGAYRTSIEAFEDGFITKLDPTGLTILYSTYIPGGVSDYPDDIAVDSSGNAYITGNTSSSDFPVTAGAFQTQMGDTRIAFVTKLNATGSDLVYSSFLGNTEFNFDDEDYGFGIRVNGAGNAYVVGYTSSNAFPVSNPIQATRHGPYDAFVTKFNVAGSALDFSTYLGGSQGESAGNIALDPSGKMYVAGGTSSTDFPVVNPYQGTNHGNWDGFIAIISEAAQPTATPTRTGTPPTATPTGCVPGALSWHNEPQLTTSRDYASGAVADGKFYLIGGVHQGMEPPYVAQVERFNPATATWDTVAPIPVAASKMAAASTGNKIYVAGGYTVRQGFTIDLMQIYDVATNTWTQGAQLPLPTSGAAAAAYNGKIYIIGGAESTSRNTVYEYDPVTNSYTSKAPMPMAQSSIAAATLGNKIYVAGGFSSVHYAYDPAADTWSTLAQPPITAGFMWAGAFALNGEIWVEGGYDPGTRRGYPAAQEVQIYNPATDSWRFGPALSNPRSRSQAAGVINGRGYVASGADLENEDTLLTSLESVGSTSCATVTGTPATATPTACVPGLSSWRAEATIPVPHSHAAAAVYNNQLYVIGGASNSPTPVPQMQRYDPASNSWAPLPPSPNGVADEGAAAIGGKIYVMGATYSPSEVFMQIYDVAANTWSRGATLPEYLANGAFTAYGGKIYIFGGQYDYPSTHVYEYDPATDTFTPKSPMPSAQAEIGAAAIGNRIYVVGGYQYIHYAYDPAADSWTTIATPPTPNFSHPGVFAFNGELWVEGGYDNPNQRGYPPSQEVQIYNPNTNSWRFGPAFNTPRYHSTSAGVIGNRAYVVGGVDLNSNSYPYDYLSSMESISYITCSTGTPVPTTVATETQGIQATATRTATLGPTGTAQATHTTTSSTATATVMSTGTAVVTTTATACAIEFSDVQPDNTFYPYVRCLACHGILGGYDDGTFRPDNPITRGQIAKIVSNAAAIEDDPGPQLFEDVPVGSTFYTWVNRLTNHGYMGGYPCGGPGEDCGPDNLPYFRPSNNANRGQISKIVSNAAGYEDTPAEQIFEDVAPDSAYYIWVERLASRGYMSGYPCGGEGEPCGPNNKPYFRPFNGATRGQTSKIVSNTFFPDCSSR